MNFKNLTYYQKIRLLFLGGLCFGVIIYFVSIQKTVDLYLQNNNLRKKLSNIEDAPKTIQKLRKQLVSYEHILKNFSNDTIQKDEYILDQITNTCDANKVTLMNLPYSQTSMDTKFRIETREVRVKGDFVNLLKFIYDLEYKVTIGRVSSVQFLLEKDRKTRTTYLGLKVYVQNLSMIKDENL